MGELGARNRALVEWSATELAPLRGILGNLRHARDREEFERFMDEHRNQQGHPSGHRARSYNKRRPLRLLRSPENGIIGRDKRDLVLGASELNGSLPVSTLCGSSAQSFSMTGVGTIETLAAVPAS
jgi:hypothetical protein